VSDVYTAFKRRQAEARQAAADIYILLSSKKIDEATAHLEKNAMR